MTYTHKKNALAVIGAPVLAGLMSLMAASSVQATDRAPWRLSQAANLPDWLSLSGTFRARYEGLDNQFRAGRSGNDQIVALRTTLLAELHLARVTIGAELEDSRAYLDDTQTPLSASIVNTAELLQGYVAVNMDGLLGGDSKSRIKVGRMTIDVGDRRLVARNHFRNTINAFTGVDWIWFDASGHRIQAFVTVPVDRRPTAFPRLDANDIQFDKEDFDTLFGGIDVTMPVGLADANLEVYALGLAEGDSRVKQTANRHLVTPGFRFYRKKAKGRIDFEVESVLQFGEERASRSPADLTNLDVFAYFEHAEIGYTLARPWSPRVVLQYDLASGDRNPSDNTIGSFDTLYGARRFDFGPTGIYGPFARRNLSSPGVRTEIQPAKNVRAMAALRGFWLASRYDAWAGTGVADPTGASGRYLGTQIEGRFRWTILPGNLQFEAGLAHIFEGGFAHRAPDAPHQGNPTYGYMEVTATF